MENIVFLDSATVIADIRRPAFAHEWAEYPATTEEQVVARLRDATIAITNKVPVCRETLKQLPRLKMVAIAATGTDNVDIESCRECGIVVSNIRNYSVHTLPEHVFMLTLALRRNLLHMPNFILTPHIAWSGRAAMQILADQLIANIEAFVAGTPNNRVA